LISKWRVNSSADGGVPDLVPSQRQSATAKRSSA
jgi:hypothetical protein